MCVSMIARVVEVDGLHAFAETTAGIVGIGLLALDERVEAGDWLLVNSGLAVARLHDEDIAALRALTEGVDDGP